MNGRARTLGELMPFPTAGELLQAKGRPLASTSPGATAVGALRLMEHENVGFLPVLDDGRLAGVVSERDIARGAMLAQRLFVRDIMITHVHTVSPEADVNDCLAVMHREGIRHLPVVSDGAILGVVSVRDLMGSLVERHERLLRRLEQERVTLLTPYSSSY